MKSLEQKAAKIAKKDQPARLAILAISRRAGGRTTMPFSDSQRQAIQEALDAYVKRHLPPGDSSYEMAVGYRFESSSVIIFTVRPRFKDPGQFVTSDTAKARYVKSRDSWTIYWQRANMKWHVYDPQPEVSNIVEFVDVVEENSYGCFHG